MKRKYDYGCRNCGEETTLELTMTEYDEIDGVVCGECGTPMSRVYIVNTPRYRQMKGHYNGNHNEYLEVKKEQSSD